MPGREIESTNGHWSKRPRRSRRDTSTTSVSERPDPSHPGFARAIGTVRGPGWPPTLQAPQEREPRDLLHGLFAQIEGLEAMGDCRARRRRAQRRGYRQGPAPRRATPGSDRRAESPPDRGSARRGAAAERARAVRRCRGRRARFRGPAGPARFDARGRGVDEAARGPTAARNGRRAGNAAEG